jgi:hypothetical protein
MQGAISARNDRINLQAAIRGIIKSCSTTKGKAKLGLVWTKKMAQISPILLILKN